MASKRPNGVGRIEGEPKVKKSLPWGTIRKTVLIVALVALGVTGTLQYQKFINDVQASGVAEYKKDNCKQFEDKPKNIQWLECEQ